MGSTKIQAAEPADIGKATADSIRAQMEAYGGTGEFSDIGSIGALEAKHRPQMEALELQTMSNMLGGVGGQRGLLDMYQNTIAPALSKIEAETASGRVEAEQGLIDKYGSEITDKLREAAGNKDLINQIVSNASGETDPALLSSLVNEASSAFGGQSVIGRGPNVLADAVQGVGVGAPTIGTGQGVEVDAVTGEAITGPSLAEGQGVAVDAVTKDFITGPSLAEGQGVTVDAVTGQTVSAPTLGSGRQVSVDPVTGQAVSPGQEAGYVGEGRAGLQPAVDAGLLAAGSRELGGQDTELDAALRSRALQRLSGGLTDAETRGLQQGQRQAWAARGLANTLPAGVAEAFYVAQRGEERARENEMMARGTASELESRRMGRVGQGAGLIGQSYGQRLGAYQADLGRSTGQQQMGLQAGMANQQTGLSAQLSNQAAQLQAQNTMLSDEQARDLAGAQMGLQAGTASAANLQGASLANQAAQLQAQGLSLSDTQARDLSRAQMGLEAQGMNQQAGLSAGLANQAAQLQAQGLSLSDTQARDLSRAQMGLQAQGMNQQTNMQGQLANQSAQLQASGMNLSDQQARDLARAQMGLQAGSMTAGNMMQSQLANQQAGLAAQESNRQYGFNVASQNEANRLSQQQANRAFRSSVLGQQDSILGSRTARQMGAAQLAQGTSADPFMAILGRPSQAMNQLQGMGGQAYGMGQGAGPSLFDPSGAMTQLSGQMAMQNSAVQNQVNMANAQSSNAMMSGLIGGAASLGGGLFAGVGKAKGWSNFWG
jgi:hypothetical protein